MYFEWDEAKRRQNVRKHKLDFLDAVEIFDGRPIFTYLSPRNGEFACIASFYTNPIFTYLSPRNGEERLATIGKIRDKLWVVVWTPRGEDTRRIISAHRADDGEERKYQALFH